MQALNRQTASAGTYPERIIQFGEGNFLRAFVDWIIYNMNKKTDFKGSVVVVQPIEQGMVDMLNAQDCLYHVNLQGLDKGETVNSLEMIDVISRALNPYSQNDEFMKLADQPEMRFVIQTQLKQVSLSILLANLRTLLHLLIQVNLHSYYTVVLKLSTVTKQKVLSFSLVN